MGSLCKWDALPKERLDPADLPRLPGKLGLGCQACGHVADYDVGTLVIRHPKKLPTEHAEI